MGDIQSNLAVIIVIVTAILYLYLTLRKKEGPCEGCGCSALKHIKRR